MAELSPDDETRLLVLCGRAYRRFVYGLEAKGDEGKWLDRLDEIALEMGCRCRLDKPRFDRLRAALRDEIEARHGYDRLMVRRINAYLNYIMLRARSFCPPLETE